MKRSVFSVLRLKRTFIFRPLAAILTLLVTLLLLPPLPPVHAQTVVPTNPIIQTCIAGGVIGPICSDLVQLEGDGVNAYLGLHNLPPADAQNIYDYGRRDLRDAVRGTMFNILLGIIAEPASARTAHEQNLYNWLQGLVQQNEIAEYTQALGQFNDWQSDPCDFTLDPDIASQYNISYDGTPFCFGGSLSSLFGGPSVPAESYFTAYGLKYSYGKAVLTYPYFPALITQTSVNVGETLGIASAASAVVVGGAAGALAASLSAALAAGTGATGIAATSAAFTLSGSTVAALGAGALVAGAVTIVLIAVAIGVAAGMQTFEQQQEIDDLNNLQNTLTQVTNTPPDLESFVTDPTGLGMYKLQATFDAQTVPDTPSTATLPAHQSSDLNFAIEKSGASSTTISTTLAYQDWNGIDWSAQTSGGWFVQNCNSGTGCPQADSIIDSIHYVDWSGVDWTAARVGNKFVNVKSKPAPTDTPCPPDPTTGVSDGPDFSGCSSYVSTSIPLQDPTGALETVSLSVLTPPVFTNPAPLPFTPSVSSTQTIIASGNPTPTICYSSSTPALPADFSVNGSALTTSTCTTNGSFTLAFNGNSASPDQTYQLTLAASNGDTANPVLQTFQVDVSQHLMITSPAELDATAGTPINFQVTTTGTPPPSLSVNSELLSLVPGLNFTDNGNGTGTFSGTVAFPSPDTSCIALSGNCGITASSTQGTVVQQFTINIASSPPAFLGPPASATFIAGAPNSVTLTSTGAITPVTWSFSTFDANAPSWLNLTDNGNGTATLFGTPPVGTTGTFDPNLGPHSVGSLEVFTSFPVTVLNIPAFLSSNTATFTVGTQGRFVTSVNQGNISLTGTLPAGLSLSPGGSLQCFLINEDGACITGTPATGTGGQYNLTLTDDAGSLGSTSQPLTVDIYEGPRITSSNSATFFTGTPNSFAVTTTGFPSLSKQPVPSSYSPPASPNDGEGMYFTVTGLPSDLQFGNLNPAGFATGTLVIQGTPSSADAGLHEVQITAQNGVGAIAEQTLALNIVTLTGPAPTSSGECNGTYNGTFQGSLTISAGQNCAFFGGGVAGNISMDGGSLVLQNSKIGGNVNIQGASAFSIDTGTTIAGSLNIQNIAPGVSLNQVCGTMVGGNAAVYASASPVELGSTDSSCLGNSFGKNVSITYDTGATGVYNNAIAKNLACSNNTSISGSGNTAGKMRGQCAAF